MEGICMGCWKKSSDLKNDGFGNYLCPACRGEEQGLDEQLNVLGCYHDNAALRPLKPFDHLAEMGYTHEYVCLTCRKRVGLNR